jgi:hypothetical protein
MSSFFGKVMKSLTLQQEQQILISARRNMPPELQACKSLADAEALLRKEEEQCLEAIKEAFNVPDQAWNECRAEIGAQIRYCRDVYFKTPYAERDHSLSVLNPALFVRITETLKMYGINPDSVNIVYDQKYHNKNPDHPAYSRDPRLERVTDETEKFKVRKYAKLSFYPSISSSYHQEFAPFHEGMHLFEGHGLQTRLIPRVLSSHNKNNLSIFSHQSLKKWDQVQEKISEIVPLIQFKNKRHVQLVYQKCMETCMNNVHNGKKITWNKTINADATHPDRCAEMLPWILKIQELMPKEPQQPRPLIGPTV